MKKSIKKYIPLALFLIILASLLTGVLYYYFTGQPSAISVEKMKSALASQNLDPIDATNSAIEKFQNAGLKDCIVVQQDDIRFEFYNFDNNSSATELYRQAHTLIITTRLANPRTEIKYGKANYQVYTLKADDIYSVAIYVANTAIYATCNAENESKINGVLDNVGYIDTVSKQSSSLWLMAVLRLIQFLVYIPIALVGRHWIWHATYKSAGLTSSDINSSEKTRKELPNWFIEKSPKAKTTKTIFALYKISLVPEYIGVALAFVGCFTTQIDSLLNKLGIIIPGIIIATGIVGLILSRKFDKTNTKNFE